MEAIGRAMERVVMPGSPASTHDLIRLHATGGNHGMADTADMNMIEDTPKAVSRPIFIKGVIAAGVAASSASYLLRTAPAPGPTPPAGSADRAKSTKVQ